MHELRGTADYVRKLCGELSQVKDVPSKRITRWIKNAREQLHRIDDSQIVYIRYVGAIFSDKSVQARLVEHKNSLQSSGASLLWTFIGFEFGIEPHKAFTVSESRIVFTVDTIVRLSKKYDDPIVVCIGEALAMWLLTGMSHTLGCNQTAGGGVWAGRCYRLNLIIQVQAQILMVDQAAAELSDRTIKVPTYVCVVVLISITFSTVVVLVITLFFVSIRYVPFTSQV